MRLVAIENAPELASCIIEFSAQVATEKDRSLEFMAASFARPGVPHAAFIEIFGPGRGELTVATLRAADLTVRLKVRLGRYRSVNQHDVANSCL